MKDVFENNKGMFDNYIATTESPETLTALTEKEKYLLLEEFNNTKVDYAGSKTVIGLFEGQAALTPNAIAVVFEEQEFTYGQINAYANQLAHFLRSKGVKEETFVPICIERSVQMIIGVLGILKAGGGYVPIDPEYPAERIQFILKDTQAVIAVTSTRSKSKLQYSKALDIVELDETFSHIDQQPATNEAASISARQLAYVIYTSGSTGKPKGVMIEHKGLANLALTQAQAFGLKPGMRTLQFASFGFDASCSEIFTTLLSGGCLVLPQKEDLLSAEVFEKLVNRHHVEVITLPPSYQQVIKNNLGTIKTIISAGEPLNEATGSYLQSKGIRLINAYGPTENTVCVSMSDDPIKSNHVIVIGKPIANVQVYILDKKGNVCPIGVAGEICVGGVQVARGYLNRPDLTAEKFVANPFSDQTDAYMYKTGDLGRWHADGNIEFLGRSDDQVKIRGYRIEPGEIEQVLHQCNLVSQAVVVAKDDKEKGTKELVAYIIPDGAFDRKGIIGFLKEKLPEYMVPSILVQVKSFQLTTSGKIDRKALPEPDVNEPSANHYVGSRNAVEQQLVDIWSDLLEIEKEKIGIYDDFFELGGHSLKVISLAASIHKLLDVKIAVKYLFKNLTIEQQAQLILQAKKDYYQLVPLEKQKYYELSFSQKRLWLLYKLNGNSTAYNYVVPAYRLTDDLNVPEFKNAIKALVERHEILRTIFIEQNGIPMQEIIDFNNIDPDVEYIDISTEEQKEAESLTLIQERAASMNFKLEEWPLFKFILIKSKQGYQLVYVMHHIICDGWSIKNFNRDLLAIYRSKVNGEELSLPKLTIQYKDFAGWQNDLIEKEKEQLRKYWMDKLAGKLPTLSLPVDFENKLTKSDNPAHYYNFYIESGITNKLDKFLLAKRVSHFSFFIACFKILLSRLTAEKDIIVGIPVANRDQHEVKDLIGFFINTILLRDSVERSLFFDEFVGKVSDNLIGALEHQSYPFEYLLQDLKIHVKSSNDFPVTPVFLNMLNIDSIRNEVLSNREEGHGEALTPAKFDLECYFKTYKDVTEISWVYNSRLFKRSTIEYWIKNFTLIVEQVLDNPAIRIKDISIFKLSVSKHIAAADFFNDEKEQAANENIISRFEQQVRKFPNNIAIIEEDAQLSYQQLNSKANGLANTILKINRTGGAKVALLLEHGKAAITGMLGALKSGNAYVPLDSSYPYERLKYIIEDIQCDIIIASSATYSLAEQLLAGMQKGTVINIDSDIIPVEVNVNLPIAPDSLAYILYTSGSTGEPKGVVQCHRNVLHFIRVYTNNLHISSKDRLSLLPSYTFDASVMDIYGAVLNGASLCSYNVKQKGTDDLTSWLVQNKVSVFHVVPSIYRYFLSTLKNEIFENVRLVVMGGEPVYKKDFEGFKKHFKEGAAFINGYGPTESTVTLQKFLTHGSSVDRTNVPIGLPVQHTEVYLLNEEDEEVGVYEVGELTYSSDYLALGYWNNQQKRVIPFTTDYKNAAGKVYRSGDLARRLPDGEFEIVGRKDNQVKIFGQRVELSEIEQNLIRIPGVNEAIVVIKRLNEEDRIVAYIRSSNEQPIAEDSIKQVLRQKLPAHMLPSFYMFVTEFPRTHSGKINKRLLPDPNDVTQSKTQYVAPQTDVELNLASIWKKTLHVEQIGTDDNFFELGGNSFKAVQVVSYANKAGYNLKPADFFLYQTIKELSGLVAKRSQDEVANQSHHLTLASNGHEKAIVALRDKGSNIPFFFAAPGFSVYTELIAYLDEDQPAYFFIPFKYKTVESIAAYYITEMKKIQPEGPYCLGGYCSSGEVALEMAQQLRASGEEVSFLALFDSYHPSAIRTIKYSERLKYYYNELINISIKEKVSLLSQFVHRKLRKVKKRTTKVINKKFKNLPTRTGSLISKNAYLAKPYNGKVLLFRSNIRIAEVSDDPYMGWSDYFTGKVQLYTVDGNHKTMFKEPGAIQIAEKLNANAI